MQTRKETITKKIEPTLYRYDELSEEAKEKAREWYIQAWGPPFDWNEYYQTIEACVSACLRTPAYEFFKDGTCY